MKISQAEFWAAATQPKEIPLARRPEIAVAGRSNVGKSSLINRVTRRRRLARTSGTPGCTRGIVFYDINQEFTLVDLPGYGWAQRSRRERAGWKQLVEAYLHERVALVGVLILVDIRRGPEAEEQELADFLTFHGIEHAWVLTKCDKLKRSKIGARLSELEEQLSGRSVIVTSSQTGVGVDALRYWMSEALGVRGGSGGWRA